MPSTKTHSLEDLLTEYDNWRGVMDHAGSGEFDTIEKIVALYRFAIANYTDPRIDLVLDLVAAVEKAGDTF